MIVRQDFRGNNQYDGKTIEDRFWEKVDIKSEDECWEWLGSMWNVYGAFWIKRERHSTHRVAWMFTTKQEIPKGKCIIHICDNPPCCNPHHLLLGTHKDNTQDMMKKGRHWVKRGEDHYESKLSEQDVKDIRFLYSSNDYSQRALAVMFNISQSSVGLIIKRKNWSHV